jgi:hypothetical protein
VGIESEEVAEGLNGDDDAGNWIIFGNRLLHEDLQGFPGAATEIGKKLPIIEKVTAADFGYAELRVGIDRYQIGQDIIYFLKNGQENLLFL